MPVYQLLGGKVPRGGRLLRPRERRRDPAGDRERAEVSWRRDSATSACRSACRAWRATARARGDAQGRRRCTTAPVFEPAAYIRRALKLFEECRKQLPRRGRTAATTSTSASRPTQALQMCKDVEKFRLFFFEDPLSPEDIAWFRLIRQQCTTPIAMGELFNSPHEWSPLITERLIDYIRVHVSQAGGLTPCRKIAHPRRSSSACGPHGTGPATSRRSATRRTSRSISSATTSASRSTRAFNEPTREVFSGRARR